MKSVIGFSLFISGVGWSDKMDNKTCTVLAKTPGMFCKIISDDFGFADPITAVICMDKYNKPAFSKVEVGCISKR